MASATRPSAGKSTRMVDSDAGSAEAGTSPSSASSSLAPASQTPRNSRPREPPPLERAVVSRTRLHITLPTPPPPSGGGKATSAGSEADQRGWSSPHGEPYRPLGRPELNLKFSPQLVYGVSPMMPNAHRVRPHEGGGSSGSGVAGSGTNSAVSEKDKELREPSSCSSASNTGASLSALVGQFVNSLASRKRPLDDRQVKLALRLQANVDGLSPERVRGLQRRKPFVQEQEQGYAGTGHGQPRSYQAPRVDTSLQLLREAIDEGTSRLRSTRNGTNFLQKLPSSDLHGLRELHEQYLRERTKTPQIAMHSGGHREATTRNTTNFTRDEDAALGCKENDDDIGWYMPYTTRQLQRSPHRRLPSLGAFRVRGRDEKQPFRPMRASKASPVPMRVSTARSNHASLASARSSIAPGAFIKLGENCTDGLQEPNVAMSLAALSKNAPSPFAAVSPSAVASVPPLHSIEKLQAAVDALETTKCQQSARLATALEVLEQDRYECLADKFRSLRVRSDAVEDLRRMRERSERHHGQRVLAVVTKTADWYPELLRRLLAREAVNGSTSVAANVTTTALLPLHAAELFIVQAVRRFTNEGCEFQATKLFEVILHLHHDDLELQQVQHLLQFIRGALQIGREEWTRFFAAHGLPKPIEDFADDRKDYQDGKPTATTVRVAAQALTLESNCR